MEHFQKNFLTRALGLLIGAGAILSGCGCGQDAPPEAAGDIRAEAGAGGGSLLREYIERAAMEAAAPKEAEAGNRWPGEGAVRPAVAAGSDGSAEKLITEVAARYDVPAGIIYGIWKKESSGLASGWSESARWPRAAEQPYSGSRCEQSYGIDFCRRQWRALQAICGQSRADGRRVCDPEAVRVSVALAMGPMQHLPTTLTDEKPEGFVLAAHAADHDGDGAFDPHALPDAMAATALLIRRLYAREGTWQRAANAYLGSQSQGYFEGTTSGRRGVIDHWRAWCATPGRCN